MNAEIIEKNKNYYKDLLRSSKRHGAEALCDALEKGGFFESACSTNHHLAEDGGLCQHSLNVYHQVVKLCNLWKPDDVSLLESAKLCALLHDVGKMGDFGKPNYIKAPLLKSGKTPAKPFISNPDLYSEEHEIRSVLISERYIHLTMEEEGAIIHHNGLFGKFDSSYSHGYDRDLLSFIVHTADMVECRFFESDGGEEIPWEK